jgi:hypothetical protein
MMMLIQTGRADTSLIQRQSLPIDGYVQSSIQSFPSFHFPLFSFTQIPCPKHPKRGEIQALLNTQQSTRKEAAAWRQREMELKDEEFKTSRRSGPDARGLY